MREEGAPARSGGALVYRQPRAVRLWHWTNAFAVIVMLMSGLMIFNAHPRLYWGQYGANDDLAWFEIGSANGGGFTRVGSIIIPTTGLLGVSGGEEIAFPALVTIPSSYDLAGARQWHFAFAWLLVIPGLLFWLWGLVSRHIPRDLLPDRGELRPANLALAIKDHVRLRAPAGSAAQRYNILQKLSYLAVIFGLLPTLVLTGLTMSPDMDAAWPWLLELFGGRQSARSIHFISAFLLVGFIVVHLLMVILTGPANGLRAIVTGWYRLPQDRSQ